MPMTSLKPLVSTAYLPSITYMSTLAAHRGAIIELYETFPKQTFRNRTTIATGNGSLTLNVPVSRPYGNHTTTNDILISNQEPWNIRHWRAIESAYNAAPFFLYYKDELENILMHRHEHLIQLNEEIMLYLFGCLKIECTLDYTYNYIKRPETNPDLRVSLTAKRAHSSFPLPHYSQVFDSRNGFISNLSVIDLLFNLGPEAKHYLLTIPNIE